MVYLHQQQRHQDLLQQRYNIELEQQQQQHSLRNAHNYQMSLPYPDAVGYKNESHSSIHRTMGDVRNPSMSALNRRIVPPMHGLFSQMNRTIPEQQQSLLRTSIPPRRGLPLEDFHSSSLLSSSPSLSNDSLRRMSELNTRSIQRQQLSSQTSVQSPLDMLLNAATPSSSLLLPPSLLDANNRILLLDSTLLARRQQLQHHLLSQAYIASSLNIPQDEGALPLSSHRSSRTLHSDPRIAPDPPLLFHTSNNPLRRSLPLNGTSSSAVFHTHLGSMAPSRLSSTTQEGEDSE
jgi:hypothetical protein